jgi:hypothetical protein
LVCVYGEGGAGWHPPASEANDLICIVQRLLKQMRLIAGSRLSCLVASPLECMNIHPTAPPYIRPDDAHLFSK